MSQPLSLSVRRFEHSPLPLFLFALVVTAFLMTIAYLLAKDMRRRNKLSLVAEQQARELETRVATRTAELSRLSTHLLNEAEAERLALARQLHDEMGGCLTAAKMDINWLQSHDPAVANTAISNKLRSASQQLDNAMNIKRRVVENLRPSLLGHFGLLVAIRAHFDDRCTEAGLKCVIKLSETLPKLKSSQELALFRVAQQALEAAIQHGSARSVTLSMEPEGDDVVMSVIDDGVVTWSANPPATFSDGLAGMRHRIAGLGGRLEVTSLAANGTRLRVTLPPLPGATAD